MNIPRRIESLRRLMDSSGVDAYIVTGSDPHGSEYPPAGWRTREWISGFSGSAGIVAVTKDCAGLWTDFRYWIQASDELSGSGIDLFKDGRDGVAAIQDWLADNLTSGDKVGFNGRTVLMETAGKWNTKLQDSGIGMVSDLDLINDIWTDRPPCSEAAVIELDEDETGESRAFRLERLKTALELEDTDSWIGIGLDSTAWLLNVRGGDVSYSPVVTGFIICSAGKFVWYTNQTRLDENLKNSLYEDGVQTADYDGFFPALKKIPESSRILIDPQSLTKAVMDHLPAVTKIKTAKDPVILMKARKNAVEVSNITRAMEKDGVAMVRFLINLEKSMEEGQKLTELDAAAMLLEERSAIPGFLEESFSPVPAFGPHAAICHYEASSESALTLQSGANLFLIDSGGQWEEGTTDITRTISLGKPTEMQIKDYTLTLKGHIAVSRARFPQGTRGYQLDALARNALWQEGINYGHGTGHGVGYRLNVHEGPHRLSPAAIDVALEPGMVVSNEPGVYRENQYGIRIENLLICREDISNEFGTFLAFDTLTLAPYDSRLINTELLNEEELNWVNEYHSEVSRRLSPMLEKDQRDWLNLRTAPLL